VTARAEAGFQRSTVAQASMPLSALPEAVRTQLKFAVMRSPGRRRVGYVSATLGLGPVRPQFPRLSIEIGGPRL
jgi:hypothetical protein